MRVSASCRLRTRICKPRSACCPKRRRDCLNRFRLCRRRRFKRIIKCSWIWRIPRLPSGSSRLTNSCGLLKDSLTKVDAKIHELETARVSAYTLLTSQLQSLGSETANLVKALRTPHTRGQWGEMQLRRAVEMAGMVDYCDFRVQQTLYAEDSRLRPDMVVMLPNGRRLIVDAKAPLSAYLDAIELEDDGQRAEKLKQHAMQVRTHVEQLAQKAYWAAIRPGAGVRNCVSSRESPSSAPLCNMIRG